MKRILLFIICLFGIFSISSCNNEVSVAEVYQSTATSVKSSYSLLSGHREFTINAKDETVVHVEITTESGDFSLTIGNSTTNEYTGNNLDTCSFDVTLSSDGVYMVQIDTKKHKGGYKITW